MNISDKKNLLGKAFKEQRITLSLTQVELCEQLKEMGIHLDRSALSRIESESRPIYDFEMIGLICALELNKEKIQELVCRAFYEQKN